MGVTKTSIDMETISQDDLQTLLETSLNAQGKYIDELGSALKGVCRPKIKEPLRNFIQKVVYLLKVKYGILFKLREQSSRVLYYMT